MASIQSDVRLTTALGLSPRIALEDPRRPASAPRAADPVHGAMGEADARHLSAFGHVVLMDEPFQHDQFAGRGDVVAVDVASRALIHIENRTRFPNVQDAIRADNTKRAYLAPAIAGRLGVRGGVASVTHVTAALWSSEVLHVVRLRESTFRAACPDGIPAFEAWWSGREPVPGSSSPFVLFDPIQ